MAILDHTLQQGFIEIYSAFHIISIFSTIAHVLIIVSHHITSQLLYNYESMILLH